MSDISSWLEHQGLGQYAKTFAENDVDIRALPELTEQDLKNLGVSLGHRRILQRAVREIPQGERWVSANETKAGSEADQAERRQLTVMFCDLVGSTSLAEALDPEEYRELLADYQSAVSTAIEQYEGYIARYMGDGLLVYFGYPRAHEDDAERAIRAGLEATSAVTALGDSADQELQVRIGIATGLVVAGDIVGKGASEERAVIGETPNLAARLQGIASPNTVVLSQSTQRLVGGRFELESLGRQSLKGISEEVLAFRAVAVHREVSRFKAAHQDILSALTGRESELGLLMQRWERVLNREGQAVLLEGEPGIGKSRLIQATREAIGEAVSVVQRFQCSPYYRGSAFYPIIDLLERTTGYSREDSVEQRIKKLERSVSALLPQEPVAIPLMASLLSIPADGYPALAISPQQQRNETIRVLVAQLEVLAEQGPMLVLLEDAHWADPTTLDVFGAIIDRIQRLPVLLLVTFRPEFESPWADYGHVSALSLNRLGQREVSIIVSSMTGGKSLPAEVLDQITAKTDGVPLFVEELTKTVLEAGFLTDQGGAYSLDGPVPPLAIPSTLQDALLSRLDRLGNAKEVAQTAACIGRDFSNELLEAVSPVAAEALEVALAQLVHSGLLFRRDEPPGYIYTFKHALMRDAAYGSLLKARRRLVHRKIAQTLEDHHPELSAAHPEVLARHFEEAEYPEQATRYWFQAGSRAGERFAHEEATVHYTRGLGQLNTLPHGRERTLQELQLQHALALSMGVTKGPVAEVQQAYERARALSEEIGEARHLYQSIWGLWYVNTLRMQLGVARDHSYELLEVAEGTGNVELLLQGHHSAWAVLLYLGELEACKQHSIEGRALYDPEKHRHHAFVYGGHDPGVCSGYHGALCEWLSGYPDRAVALVGDAIELARKIEQPSSEIIALSTESYIHQFRGDASSARRASAEMASIAQERGNARYLETARLLQGWAAAATGSLDSGIETMEQSLSALKRMGGNLRRTYYLALLVEMYIKARRFGDARAALAEADSLAEEFGERWWSAELLRLHGELLLAEGSAPSDEVESRLQSACEVAVEQGAIALELRASVALAKHRSALGQFDSARDCLAPVFGRFKEGFDTADLVEATLLLARLS